MANIGNLIQRAQKVQHDMARLQEELKERMVEGSAGDGAVTAIVSCNRTLMSVRISPSVVDPDDVETIEDLVIAAVNNGLEKAAAVYREETDKLTGGMGLPGL